MATTSRSTSHSKSGRAASSTSRSGAKSRSTAGARKASSTAKGSRTKASTRIASHSSTGSAHKSGRKTAHGQAWTDQHSDNPSSTGQGKAKKEPAKQNSTCWPGYEPVPGKPRGTKGSCKPKAHQTAAEKKSDAMAASASRLRKAGGNKARANH